LQTDETSRPPVTWLHLVTFAIVTGVCTVLAVFAVISAPVPPAPGVSGLYIAAAVYVPVALWFGLWGALAGYASCVLLGLWTGMPILFVLWWSLADFFEGLVPLLAFRLFKVDPEFRIERRGPAAIILALLVVDLVVAALATAIPAIGGAAPITVPGLGEFGIIYLISFLLAVVLMAATIVVTRSKAWTLYVLFGILAASLVSAVVGASVVALGDLSGGTTVGLAMAGVGVVALVTAISVAARYRPALSAVVYVASGLAMLAALAFAIFSASGNPAYGIVLFGWGFGDVIVLSTIGTMLMTILTPFIKRTQVYIQGWLS
jgi:hypothetical protein